MNKKDVLELRRRFTKDCTISRMAGCYVDCNKNTVLKLNENFLNLHEDEFFKFLDIAKKTMSGTIGNNILEIAFPADEEEPGGKQQFLRTLMASNLKNEELLDRLYELIIERFTYTGNYLILVFHDSYDILTKTTDNLKLDESEEVYEYLLVSICPVDLSKPGLGYRSDENKIGSRIRDWVVGAPALGFLFPAFDNRSADIHKVDYFVRDAKDSHPEFIEDVLGCSPKRTATEQRKTFETIVKRTFADSEEKADEVLLDIQESLNSRNEELLAEEPDAEPVVFSAELCAEVLEENGVASDKAKLICDTVKEEFADELPLAESLVDARAIKANAQVKKEKELIKEVFELKNELKKQKEARTDANDDAASKEENDPSAADNEYSVVLNVHPDKVAGIRSQLIGDQRCLVIPLDEDDHVKINGKG